MTTDRTAAARPAALADRPSVSDRGQRADAFSALLDAAAPKGDAPASRTAAHRHDDGSRALRSREDGPHRAGRKADEQRVDAPARGDRPQEADRHSQEPNPDPSAEAARQQCAAIDDGPRSEASGATSDAAAASETAQATTAAASSFALGLASPLPPAVVAAPGSPEAASEVAAPALLGTAGDGFTLAPPALAGLVAASVATATTAASGAAIGEAASATPGAPGAAQPVDAGAIADPAATAPAQVGDEAPPSTAPPSETLGRPTTQPPSESLGRPATPPPTAVSQADPDVPAEPVPAQPVAATPIAPAAASPLGHVERAVPLSRAIPTTGVLIQLAAERGITHARLNLKPAELGGIEVKLQTTPGGIHAQLVADSPEAARMLAQAGDDLRRQLEARDVNLLSLDVSTSRDQRHDQPGFSAHGFGDDHRPGGYPPGFRTDAVLMETPLAADTVLVLPDGVHVDVLA